MTNEQIILNARYNLLEAGALQATGRTLETKTENGIITQIPEPEEIHTFTGWLAHGYRVKKGEHAISAFQIWKYKKKSNKKDDEETAEADDSFMFLTKAFFFSPEQVERIEVQHEDK